MSASRITRTPPGGDLRRSPDILAAIADAQRAPPLHRGAGRGHLAVLPIEDCDLTIGRPSSSVWQSLGHSMRQWRSNGRQALLGREDAGSSSGHGGEVHAGRSPPLPDRSRFDVHGVGMRGLPRRTRRILLWNGRCPERCAFANPARPLIEG